MCVNMTSFPMVAFSSKATANASLELLSSAPTCRCNVIVLQLQMLERFWLKDSSFIAGNEISIADLLMVTELDMLNALEGATEVRNLPILTAMCF